jgi:hypothetical protein
MFATRIRGGASLDTGDAASLTAGGAAAVPKSWIFPTTATTSITATAMAVIIFRECTGLLPQKNT